MVIARNDFPGAELTGIIAGCREVAASDRGRGVSLSNICDSDVLYGKCCVAADSLSSTLIKSTRTIEVNLQHQGYPYVYFQDYRLPNGKLVLFDI